MKIIFHIFKKDFRRHWPEFLVSLIFLAIFLWDQPRQWTVHPPEFRFFSSLLRYLPHFLSLSWAFLLIRLVQGESLVGDRQFWLTRPYKWHTLLSAKLLAALLLVHLPLFLAQLLLLKLAFYPVLASVPGLLQIQFMFFSIITLGSFVVGSITRGVGEAALVVLGLFLLLLAIASLSFVFPSLNFSLDDFDDVIACVAFAAATTIVVVQFARRRAPLSWCILAACVASILLLTLISGNPSRQTRNMPLPTASHPLPVKLTFDSGVSFQHQPGEQLDTYGSDPALELPFLLDGIPENSLVQIAGVKLDLDLPSGDRWTSYWHSDSEILVPGRTRVWPSIAVKRAIFDRIRNSSVNARLSLAFNVYRFGASSAIFVMGDSLRLPDDTRCTRDRFSSRMRCFSALKAPGAFVLFADLPNANCRARTDRDSGSWAAAPAVYASLSDSSTPDFGFTPIRETYLYLTRKHGYEDRAADVPLCAGTTLVLARTKFQYTVRTEIDLGNIRPSNYVPSFPREILPKIPSRPSRNPSDTLSFNFLPPDWPRIASKP
ncbi:MAG TPA: hypothetical protein VKP58_03075 [Candidatus Acidoferrum sp.]|nr:hypothetical protein [Candidatus Acidoferrum sp.]